MLLGSIVGLALAAARPAVAEQTPVDRHVVTLTQVERCEGVMAPIRVVCLSKGSCVGRIHIGIRGRRHEYFVIGEPRGDRRVSIGFVAVERAAPGLSFGQDHSLDIPILPDGTGLRDAAVEALVDEETPRGMDDGILVRPFGKERVPLANIRVTVHREDAGERSR
jgi:hypothetical protein